MNGEEERLSKDMWYQICVGRVNDDLNEYIAHCWELDLISLGNTVNDTIHTLLTTIDVQFDVFYEEAYNGESRPELLYNCDRSWKVWHINATQLKTIDINELATAWIDRHKDMKLNVIILENFSETIERIDSLNECYNLFEVLKNINCQLDRRHRLQLSPVKSNKDYYSLQGTGYSANIQSYPLPVFQLYNLSAHHISQIIRRYCLQSIDIAELHLMQA